MISVLDSDSYRSSDQEKGQPVEENRAQAEKPKVADARKRGRPRKPTKSPKGSSHRTSDESLKNCKPRSRTRGVGSPMKRKMPVSKPTITTSDDGSDDRSQDGSSDSDSDRPARISPVDAAINEKRRSRVSGSSSEDEGPPNGKNNSASEDDNTRWRRVSIKRSKLADSPKKQEKKKSPAKAKPRRSNSRVTNVGGSDSDSESEMSVRNRIQVAR